MSERENLEISPPVEADSLQERVLERIDADMAPLVAKEAELQAEMNRLLEGDARLSEIRACKNAIREFRADQSLFKLKMLRSAVRREPGGASKIEGIVSVTQQTAKALGIE